MAWKRDALKIIKQSSEEPAAESKSWEIQNNRLS